MSHEEITGLDPRTNRPIRLTMDAGMIARIQETTEETELYVSPGFVDLQVNGYAGFDLNAEQISSETVIGLVDGMLLQGATCFAPTLITASEERIGRALRVIAETRQKHGRAAVAPTPRLRFVLLRSRSLTDGRKQPEGLSGSLRSRLISKVLPSTLQRW